MYLAQREIRAPACLLVKLRGYYLNHFGVLGLRGWPLATMFLRKSNTLVEVETETSRGRNGSRNAR